MKKIKPSKIVNLVNVYAYDYNNRLKIVYHEIIYPNKTIIISKEQKERERRRLEKQKFKIILKKKKPKKRKMRQDFYSFFGLNKL